MDAQAIGVGVGAILTAFATLVGGVYTGRNSARHDEAAARSAVEEARFAREKSEEVASRQRIEALVEDLTSLRKRLREIEEESDRRYNELRRHAQRGWDLASHHFGLVSVLAHLLNNIFTVAEISGSSEQIVNAVKNSKARIASLTIPESLEEAIPEKK